MQGCPSFKGLSYHGVNKLDRRVVFFMMCPVLAGHAPRNVCAGVRGAAEAAGWGGLEPLSVCDSAIVYLFP